MQPQSPDPKFDFMLNTNQPVKSGLSIPHAPKPVKIALAVVGAIILLIIISSVLSGNKGGSSQPIVDAMAEGQEIVRVTTIIQQQQLQLQDPTNQALAATVTSSLSSDEKQLTSYLATNHIKVSAAQLAIDLDKTTDTAMQSASQNNNLDAVYVIYLRGALGKYLTELQAADKSTGPKGQVILKSAIDSTTTLLTNSPLKS